MKKLIQKIKHLVRDEEGATMVEYAIMVAMIAIVAVVAVTYFGSQLSNEYDSIADSVQNYGRP